jgi:hypothetical protein
MGFTCSSPDSSEAEAGSSFALRLLEVDFAAAVADAASNGGGRRQVSVFGFHNLSTIGPGPVKP